MKQPAVYVMTNPHHKALCTGVTSHLVQRIYQHKHLSIKGFTCKYNCTKLVYYEVHESMEAAISREKQLKAGSRAKKIAFIESRNPTWADLYLEIC